MATKIVITDEERPYYEGYLVDLKKAYFSGASRVKYRDRDTTFRTKEEMAAIIGDLQEALNPTTTPRSGAAFAEYGSGL